MSSGLFEPEQHDQAVWQRLKTQAHALIGRGPLLSLLLEAFCVFVTVCVYVRKILKQEAGGPASPNFFPCQQNPAGVR